MAPEHECGPRPCTALTASPRRHLRLGQPPGHSPHPHQTWRRTAASFPLGASCCHCGHHQFAGSRSFGAATEAPAECHLRLEEPSMVHSTRAAASRATASPCLNIRPGRKSPRPARSGRGAQAHGCCFAHLAHRRREPWLPHREARAAAIALLISAIHRGGRWPSCAQQRQQKAAVADAVPRVRSRVGAEWLSH